MNTLTSELLVDALVNSQQLKLWEERLRRCPTTLKDQRFLAESYACLLISSLNNHSLRGTWTRTITPRRLSLKWFFKNHTVTMSPSYLTVLPYLLAQKAATLKFIASEIELSASSLTLISTVDSNRNLLNPNTSCKV